MTMQIVTQTQPFTPMELMSVGVDIYQDKFMDYTITLTDTEKKSMEFVAFDVKDWISNAAKERARVAKEEIIAINKKHCNANSIAIAVGEDAQVTQAFTLGIIKTAIERKKENEAHTERNQRGECSLREGH